jgi:hypothetical protein
LFVNVAHLVCACCSSCIFFRCSAIGSLKISDEIPDFKAEQPEPSDIEADDSASKISIASSTKDVQNELLLMAMKKIQELENKIDELNEKQAAFGGSPLERKKKDGEFSVSTWSSRITETGYFKGNGGNVFNTNGARMAYINMLMEHYKTSEFSHFFLDERFEEKDDEYPTFQALLNARPIPHDFEGCNLTGKNRLTSNYVKVSAVTPIGVMDRYVWFNATVAPTMSANGFKHHLRIFAVASDYFKNFGGSLYL